MSTVRYQVDEVTEDQHAHAFFPVPGITPAAQSSISRFVHGYPGTMRVASPRPAGAYRASPSSQWHPPSEVAPDWFAPQLWWNDIAELPVGPTASGRGVRFRPGPLTALIPVPVVDQSVAAGPPPIAMRGRKIGGRRSMHWPRTLIRWPNLKGEY